MPRKRFPPDDPREWLSRGRGNWVRAANPVPGAYWEDFCYDAQQAAEKAIKAVLIQREVAFPYTHDLARLVTLLEQSGLRIPAVVRKSEFLSRFAVVTRYPGLGGPVTKSEYRRALRIAEAVLAWAGRLIAPPPSRRARHRRDGKRKGRTSR